MSQAYDDKKAIETQMRPTPSALYNNLTLAGGSTLFYVHNYSACMLTPIHVKSDAPAEVRRMDNKNADSIYCIKAFTHDDNHHVVLGTDGGIQDDASGKFTVSFSDGIPQVWEKSGAQMLHSWSFSATDRSPDATTATFVRGISVNMAADGTPNLCFGSSLGTLHVMQMGPGNSFSAPITYSQHKCPITCLSSSYQTRQGRWTEDMGCHLVSADESGEIVVWEAPSSDAYKASVVIPSTGVPAVSLAIRNDMVIAARLDGCVQIYGMNDGKLRAEIASHSRWLTAMDIHPTKVPHRCTSSWAAENSCLVHCPILVQDMIATVSEDCTVHVWGLPIGAQKATNLMSTTWNNALLTGVAFCGPTFDDVAVVAQDLDKVTIYKPGRPT